MNCGQLATPNACDRPSVRFDGCRNGGLQGKASLGYKWESVSTVKPFLHKNSPIAHLVMHAAIVADQTECRDLHKRCSCARAACCYWPENSSLGTEIVGKDGKIRRPKDLMIILVQRFWEAVWCAT